MSSQDYPGQQLPISQNHEFNAQEFMIERLLAKISTASLVQVQKVTTTGAVAAVGQVDVLPLVNMVDGVGTNYQHGTVHNLAYFRLQGGSKAIIMDPKVNDIGVAVYADRDISSVKKNKKQSPPGSYRRFDMADGIFFPCVLGGSPTSYIQFQDDGTIVLSPDNGTTVVTIKAGKVQVKVSSMLMTVSASRIDLGADAGAAPYQVETSGGPSTKVWSVI